jgi:hypothetical protein
MTNGGGPSGNKWDVVKTEGRSSTDVLNDLNELARKHPPSVSVTAKQLSDGEHIFVGSYEND